MWQSGPLGVRLTCRDDVAAVDQARVVHAPPLGRVKPTRRDSNDA